ncbi:hypothetical protein AB5J62_26210 [Amycolatopsis sp. cg5]|uniref:hypothetical protein n=1 Tax=Amycolatopsis sp. cg5 TaxID=3238802 RepID=UPI003524C881
MYIYRCATDDADYIGLASSTNSVLITINEANSTDGYADAAELDLTGSDARFVADKLRIVLAGTGKAGEVCGVYVGRTESDKGVLISVGVDGGGNRSVILSSAQAADFADRMTVTASEVDDRSTETATVDQRAAFAELTRRAAALKITATVFEVAEVDLFDAAEWVATETESDAAA